MQIKKIVVFLVESTIQKYSNHMEACFLVFTGLIWLQGYNWTMNEAKRKGEQLSRLEIISWINSTLNVYYCSRRQA